LWGKRGYKYVANCYTGVKTELFVSLDPAPLDFLFVGWLKREVCKRKVGTPDELPASILDAAGRMTKGEDQLRRTTRRDLRRRAAHCIQVDGGIL
jgi:hypothetical protein